MEPTSTNPSLNDLLHHADWLTKLARILVDDPHAADDVAQETWLAMLRRRSSQIANPKRYLRRVVKNEALRRSHATPRGEQASETLDERPFEARESLERLELQTRVATAVASIEEPYRTCVLLRFFEDLPPRRIAAQLQAPVETVKSRIKRGLALLRGKLEAEFGDGEWRAALGLLLARVPRAAGPTISVSLPWVGVLIVNVKALLFLTCSLLLSLGLLFARGSTEDDAPLGTPATPELAQAVEPVEITESAPRRSSMPRSPQDEHPASADGVLRVQVHASNGEPRAGIPIALATEVRISRSNQAIVEVVHRRATDEAGSVTFPEFEEVFDALTSRQRCVVFVMGHLRSVPHRYLEGPEETEEPIQFTLPPHGSVSVRVVDGSGDPITQGGSLWMTEASGLTPSPEALSPLHGRPEDERSIDGGALHFPVVEPNTRLLVQVKFPTATSHQGFASLVPPLEHAGPAPGEHLDITMTVHGLPVVRGRLVDEHEMPIANRAYFAWYLEEPNPHRMPITLRTDAEGVFRFLVSPAPLYPGSRRFVQLAEREHAIDFDRFPEGRGAIAALPESLSARHDLGDLRLRTEPLLLAGHVVDASGTPISQASVYAAPPWRATSWMKANRTTRWARRTTTDANGRFRLESFSFDERIKLVVRAPGQAVHASTHPVGTEDVRVELATSATLRGVVLTDAGFAASTIELQVEDPTGQVQRVPLAPDGSFALEDVPPGDHRVRVVTPRPSRGNVTRPGVLGTEGQGRTDHLLTGITVRVEPARENRPSALDPLDLRGLLRRHELTLLDENGAPIAMQNVQLHGTLPMTGRVDDHGRIAWIDLEAGAETRWLTTAGYRATRIDLTNTTPIRIERALSIALVPAAPLDIPTGRGFLSVTLQPLDTPEGIDRDVLRQHGDPRIMISSSGRIEASAPWPGRYRIVWEKGQRFLAAKTEARIEGEELVVTDSSAPQTFAVDAPRF